MPGLPAWEAQSILRYLLVPKVIDWTKDRRYWMAMRCFIRPEETPLSKMEQQACREDLAYLRDKLVRDLEMGSKIFVFKDMFQDLPESEVAIIDAAVRNYGNMYIAIRTARRCSASERPGGARQAWLNGGIH